MVWALVGTGGPAPCRLKVRDQDLCRTGSVLFVRQPCGRYDERESEEQIMTEMQGKVLDKDRLPWMGLVTP